MREVAEASGTARTSLHRHVPGRQALAAAIDERILNEADAIIAGFLDTGRDTHPVEPRAGLAGELAGLGNRNRFLPHRIPVGVPTPFEATRTGEVRLRYYLATGQQDGRIRSDLQADWLLAMLIATVSHATGHSFDSIDAGSETVHATLDAIPSPAARMTSPPRGSHHCPGKHWHRFAGGQSV